MMRVETMNAVKFLIEFNRMCKMFRRNNCIKCPRSKKSKTCNLAEMKPNELCELVNDVAEFSINHPRKTRKQDFLEKHPNAKLEVDGTPKVCCADLGYCEECIQEVYEHVGCEGCWDDYLEDDE